MFESMFESITRSCMIAILLTNEIMVIDRIMSMSPGYWVLICPISVCPGLSPMTPKKLKKGPPRRTIRATAGIIAG